MTAKGDRKLGKNEIPCSSQSKAFYISMTNLKELDMAKCKPKGKKK